MTGSAADRDERRVSRMVGTLGLYPEVRVPARLLAEVCSTKHDPINLGDIHRLWPWLEKEVLATKDLFLIRPLQHLSYGIVATADERLVLAQKRKRNQIVGTMLSRDVNDRAGILERLTHSVNGQWAATAARALERDEAWLASRKRGEADPMDELIGAALRDITKLPWLEWDGHGLAVHAVGANGLPL